ncbi:DUF4426 domain-containing protein [Dokdonella sp.]|uniref:DUF4426 domain-containing protein n=1 Tax=Dokdonella sp. TaxID=2291710 RepID=UPI003528BAE4
MPKLFRAVIGLILIALSSLALADNQESSLKFGDHVVHFSALPTDFLSEEIAKQYAIERSPNRGMLNISVQKDLGDGATQAVAASITGEATNLAGQDVPIEIREIPGSYVSYVGLFDINAPDTYTFTFSVTPEGATVPLTLRFNKNFTAR